MRRPDKKILWIICIGIGLFCDLLLRLSSGDEGNLLVHSVVVFGGAGLFYGLVRLVMLLFK